MKSIKWHSHAKIRQIERNIDAHLIVKALQQPDQTIYLAGKKRIIQKRYHDSQSQEEYLLRIFVEEFSTLYLIRSVYRTSKIGKYWRTKK